MITRLKLYKDFSGGRDDIRFEDFPFVDQLFGDYKLKIIDVGYTGSKTIKYLKKRYNLINFNQTQKMLEEFKKLSKSKRIEILHTKYFRNEIDKIYFLTTETELLEDDFKSCVFCLDKFGNFTIYTERQLTNINNKIKKLKEIEEIEKEMDNFLGV